MFWLDFAIVLVILVIGARLGGIFMGMAGGLGLAILAFILHLTPTSPPIDVMLIILAVVIAASSLQAAGGMDYLIQIAEYILRKNPSRITSRRIWIGHALLNKTNKPKNGKPVTVAAMRQP